MVAVAWTAIALLGATLGALIAAIFQLGGRIDAQGSQLGARIDALSGRIDAQSSQLGARIDALSERREGRAGASLRRNPVERRSIARSDPQQRNRESAGPCEEVRRGREPVAVLEDR